MNAALPLSSFLFYRLYRTLLVPWLLLNLGVAFALGWLLLDYALDPVDRSIHDMHQITQEVDHELDALNMLLPPLITASTLQARASTLNTLFAGVLNHGQFLYGIAYANALDAHDPGTYLSRNEAGRLDRQRLTDIYAPYGKNYRTRLWFTRALNSRQPVWSAPDRNWARKSAYMLTRSQTLRTAQGGQFLLAYDVPMTLFQNALQKLITSWTDGALYYLSHPEDDPEHPVFINLTAPDASGASGLQRTLLGLSRQDADIWHFQGGAFYKKIALLNGQLTLIVRLGTARIAAALLVWLSGVALLCSLSIWLLRKNLTRKITTALAPISALSAAAQNLAANRLERPQGLALQTVGIREIDALLTHFEQMRLNLKELLDTEVRYEKSQAELALAARIQRKFLHPEYACELHVGGYETAVRAHWVCAGRLSGDLYEVIHTPDALVCLMGDATGKDVTAAIFSSFVIAKFRELATQLPTAEAILDALNVYLCGLDVENMFISAICLRVDYALAQCRIAVAGHEPPWVYDGQHWQACACTEPDLVLGVLVDSCYHGYALPLHSCRALLCYTDGVSEARNASGQLLGEAGIQNFLATTSATDLSLALIEYCQDFSAAPPEDDMTVLALSITPHDPCAQTPTPAPRRTA